MSTLHECPSCYTIFDLSRIQNKNQYEETLLHYARTKDAPQWQKSICYNCRVCGFAWEKFTLNPPTHYAKMVRHDYVVNAPRELLDECTTMMKEQRAYIQSAFKTEAASMTSSASWTASSIVRETCTKWQIELKAAHEAYIKQIQTQREELIVDLQLMKKELADQLVEFKNQLKGELFQDLTDYVTAMLELKAESPYDEATDHNPAVDLIAARELKRKQEELDNTMNNLTNYEFSDQE